MDNAGCYAESVIRHEEKLGVNGEYVARLNFPYRVETYESEEDYRRQQERVSLPVLDRTEQPQKNKEKERKVCDVHNPPGGIPERLVVFHVFGSESRVYITP